MLTLVSLVRLSISNNLAFSIARMFGEINKQNFQKFWKSTMILQVANTWAFPRLLVVLRKEFLVLEKKSLQKNSKLVFQTDLKSWQNSLNKKCSSVVTFSLYVMLFTA